MANGNATFKNPDNNKFLAVDESGMAVASEMPCYFTPMFSAADRKAGAACLLCLFTLPACLPACL